ncbi:MAG: 2-dehydropantoate 2-reductase [Lachnospiraceae bacterium]|nr:2-dehydropantoate 2-reductase [Lachnospiraceae bacterium]
MKIYVDFDDCLCETGRAFSDIAARLFGKDVPYEQIQFFNLQDSFELTDEEYQKLMIEGHRPEVLLSFEETPGACEALKELINRGHEVCVITGRPLSSSQPSRRWLDEHGLERASLFFLNKYGRDSFYRNNTFNLELEDYYRMTFDYAIEDSPLAFRFFEHLPDLKVMLYDRPWNRKCNFPNDNFTRCFNWQQIMENIRA